eukprot:m.321958 g.321958  ORF g.321958 m.321958 type:complete len:496 (+) comp20340_c0_seq1:79-1566(+)
MGAYLDKPRTEKVTTRNSIGEIHVAVSEMQGWRMEMEDASLIDLMHASDLLLFGVFDGHGGKEVAKYTAAKLGSYLLQSYTTAPASDLTTRLTDLKSSLYKAFLEIDASILRPDVIAELTRIAGVSETDGQDDMDTSTEYQAQEIDLLKQEAAMSVEELRKKYGGEASAHDSSGGGASFQEKWSGLLHALVGRKAAADGDWGEADAGAADDSEESTTSDESEESSGDETDEKPDDKQSSDACADSPISAKRKRIAPDPEAASDNDDAPSADSNSNHEPRRRKIEQEDEEDAVGVSSGTTATVAVVLCSKANDGTSVPRPTHIVVANAGDSRCVLCRGGKAKDLSEDHKPEDEVESTRIHAAGGFIDDGRVNGGLNLSRAIGDHMYKRNASLPLHQQMITAAPDVVVEPLQDDDAFFVLACDGIWNSMESGEVIDFVKERLEQGKEVGAICEQLCDACMSPSLDGDGTGCDNETAMIVLLNKSSIGQAEWTQQTSF